MTFCKRILCVKSSTCNMAIYGEMGRYPLYINKYTRIIQFWCKIIHSDNIIIKKLYEDMFLSANDNWAKQVKLLLNSYGFTYVWINPDSVNLKTFRVLFQSSVLDNFKQAWWQNICNSGTLCTYKYLKASLSIEAYLDILPKTLTITFVFSFFVCRNGTLYPTTY